MNDDAILQIYREALPLEEKVPGLYEAASGERPVASVEDYFRSVPLFAEPMTKPSPVSTTAVDIRKT